MDIYSRFFILIYRLPKIESAIRQTQDIITEARREVVINIQDLGMGLPLKNACWAVDKVREYKKELAIAQERFLRLNRIRHRLNDRINRLYNQILEKGV